MSDSSRRVLFVFLDGVGLGEAKVEAKADADIHAGSKNNPLSAAQLPVLTGLSGGPWTAGAAALRSANVLFRPLDTTLGVEGLPQSATGQTTLLTGLNAAQAMNRHYGPWPGPTLQKLLQQGTLFHDGQSLGTAVLANAYPEGYFAHIDTRAFKPNAPVVAARSAQVELRNMDRYRAGQAVAADLSGERFANAATGTSAQSPEQAAAVLADLARQADFTFFDLWVTDAIGHEQDGPRAEEILQRLDALVGGLMNQGAGEEFTLVITSDHGNIEDLSTRGHTMNNVPLLVVGQHADEFAAAESLTDVAPAIRGIWQRH